MRSTAKLLNSDAVFYLFSSLAGYYVTDRILGLFCTICLQQNSISALWCKYNDYSVCPVTSVFRKLSQRGDK